MAVATLGATERGDPTARPESTREQDGQHEAYRSQSLRRSNGLPEIGANG